MRRASAAEALGIVGSGETLFVHGGASTPTTLLSALAERGRDLDDVRVYHLHTEGPAPHLDPSLQGRLRHHALFIGANARQAVNEGRADYVPVFLSDVPALFSRGQIPVDAALVSVSPPDAHGYCSL